MLKLYGIPNCNTVKKARDWLASQNIELQFHDFKKHGVSAELFNGWLKQTPWEKLVNRAGTTWRNLSEGEKAAVTDAQSALALMLAKPSVIKRPVLLRGEEILLIGFDEAAYLRALTP
ncbi:MAG: ArsC family reductase [Methylophilaceae bacterium]|nr:ArsC family reductase [Methylophilaceae bacterium]